MTNKELKTLWKLAKILWIGSFLIWGLETIIFLLIEGWHLKATNPIEIFIDKTVVNVWNFALNLSMMIGLFFIINLNKK
jgi:hypothetical protein